MATVYLGRWIGEGGFRKVVAVKALHPELAGDPEFRAMFLDEARVVARIRHPNVMPTVDLVEERGELFIVMDFLEGATLSALVSEARLRGETIPSPVIKRILCGVLHGLHAAHEARDERGEPLGVIHRDVAPDNIMVGADGYARIIDFGIARAAGRSTQTRSGMIKGKLAYLSPEQLLEEPLTRRTDLYGAAVVGWQLLARRRLFDGDNAADIAMKIVRGASAPPSAHGGDSSLDATIMRGLSLEPAARWESGEAMAEAIEAVGGLASQREVGVWVRRLAAEKIAETARLVERIESHAVSAPVPIRRMTRSPSWDVLEPITPPGEQEAARTDVTSEADTPSPAPASRLHHLLIAVLIVGSVVGTMMLRELALPDAATPAPSTIVITAAPATDADPPPPAPAASEPAGDEAAPGELSSDEGSSNAAVGSASPSPPSGADVGGGPMPRRVAPTPVRPRPRVTPQSPRSGGTRFPSDI
jgi:eukaryotic-like serine/threonine-protein kinase